MSLVIDRRSVNTSKIEGETCRIGFVELIVFVSVAPSEKPRAYPKLTNFMPDVPVCIKREADLESSGMRPSVAGESWVGWTA